MGGSDRPVIALTQGDPAGIGPEVILAAVGDEPPHDWVAEALGTGDRLGYDPWLHTPDGLARYRTACKKAGAELVAEFSQGSLWRLAA